MLENQNIREIKQRLSAFYEQGSLAGTWLFSGMKGIGKASVALDMAEMILGKTKEDKIQVRKKVHPDLLYIERSLTETEKKEIIKLLKDGKAVDDSGDERKKSAEITVDDIRAIDGFVRLSSATGWKIIIIDAADEMNLNAANAALKIIEEPPKNTVIFLIAHNERRLLPTILSRVKKVHFYPFTDEDIIAVLKNKEPELADNDAKMLASFAKGSVGEALNLLENNAPYLFSQLLELYDDFPKLNVLKAYKLAEKADKDEGYYETLKGLYLGFLAALVKAKNGAEDSGEILLKISNKVDAEKVLDLWEKTERLYREATIRYLDKKQVLVNSFLELGIC